MNRRLVLLVLAACGDDVGSMPAVDAAPMNPPTKFVYLNFEGVSMQQGDPPNPATNTWLSPSRTLAPFLVSHPNRAEVLDAIVAQTTEMLAPYDIGVTRERPAEKYMMIVLTGLAADNGADPMTSGEAGLQCGLSGYSSVTSTQYEYDDANTSSVEALANHHSFQTIAEVGQGHGVVDVTLDGNCMCWAASNCGQTFDYSAQRCTIDGMATINPDAPCPHTGTTIDVGAEFLAKLKPHP